MANYVQDMIINQLLRDRIMRYSDNNKYMEEPKDAEGKNTCLFVPKEYTGRLIFEELYEWMKEKKEEWQKEQKKNEQCKTCNGTGKVPKDSKGKGKQESKDGQGNYGKEIY